jgi:transcriptional regulator with XRE-family HTH domain
MASDTTDSPDAAADQLALGRALRQLRQRAGVTQLELATRANTDDTYISQVEKGHIGVRWHTTMRLLRALDATLLDLATTIAENTDDLDA